MDYNMPFNPDEYLKEKTGFNPDEYLAVKTLSPIPDTAEPQLQNDYQKIIGNYDRRMGTVADETGLGNLAKKKFGAVGEYVASIPERSVRALGAIAGLPVDVVGETVSDVASGAYKAVPDKFKQAMKRTLATSEPYQQAVKGVSGGLGKLAPLASKYEKLPEWAKQDLQAGGNIVNFATLGLGKKVVDPVVRPVVEKAVAGAENAIPKTIGNIISKANENIGTSVENVGKNFMSGEMKIKQHLAKKGYGKNLIEKKMNLINNISKYGLESSTGNYRTMAEKASDMASENFNKADEIIKNIATQPNTPLTNINNIIDDVAYNQLESSALGKSNAVVKSIENIQKDVELAGLSGEQPVDVLVSFKRRLDPDGKLFKSGPAPSDDDAVDRGIRKLLYLNTVKKINEIAPDAGLLNKSGKELLDISAIADDAASRIVNLKGMSLTDRLIALSAGVSAMGSMAAGKPGYGAGALIAGGLGYGALKALGNGRGASAIISLGKNIKSGELAGSARNLATRSALGGVAGAMVPAKTEDERRRNIGIGMGVGAVSPALSKGLGKLGIKSSGGIPGAGHIEEIMTPAQAQQLADKLGVEYKGIWDVGIKGMPEYHEFLDPITKGNYTIDFNKTPDLEQYIKAKRKEFKGKPTYNIDNIDKQKNFASISKNSDEFLNDEGDLEYGPEYNLVDKVQVEESLRNRGIGRKLLEDEIEKIDNDLPIRLSADPGDKKTDQNKLIEFYRSMGFEEDPYTEGMQGVVMSMPDKTHLIKKGTGAVKETPQKQIHSDNFKKWFGDWQKDPASASKVVDDKGEPLVVYHGTGEQFNSFKIGKNKRSDSGAHFFTDDNNIASGYGKNIVPAYLTIKDPVTLDFEGKSTVFFDGKYRTPSDLTKRIKEINRDIEKKYRIKDDLREELDMLGWSPLYSDKIDGIILKNIDDNSSWSSTNKIANHYIVFEPTQIKSATGNSGAFNPLDPNISKAIIPTVASVGAVAQMLDKNGKNKK